jgi:GxxExxY protein
MDMISENQLTRKVIGLGIEVHRELGPGLLEAAYEECLVYEFKTHGISFKRQSPVSLSYKSTWLECGFRADLIVEDRLIVELKAIEKLLPIHEAQVITYLRLTGIRIGLLMNFNAKVLKDGLRRLMV